MNFKNLIAFDARIGGIWPLVMVCPPSDTFIEAIQYSKLPPQLDYLIDDWSEDERAQLFDADEPEMRDAWEALSGSADLHGEEGFLAMVEVPVFTCYADGSRSYSWGHYQSKLVYGRTLEALEAEMLAFANSCISNAKDGTKA